MTLRFPGSRSFSRRAVLRGAGVALTLPWLESLAPRAARAQAPWQPPRLLPIFFPTGAPELWKPKLTGSGAAWQLSSVLEPLTPIKQYVTVLSGMENGSVFNADGSNVVEPAHGRQAGAWLTCVDADAVRLRRGDRAPDVNGISFDQVMAGFEPAVGGAPLPTLQLGLSSIRSYCDGRACSLSRSVSWLNETTPLYKLVDPRRVFDKLVGAAPSDGQGQTPVQVATENSVLDAVLESAQTVRGRLGAYDQRRMDEFMASVREVEMRINAAAKLETCEFPKLPPFPEPVEDGYGQTGNGYDKGVHADLMNELIALAFQCNLTRIVSYMLEDEYCDYVYDNVPRRVFTEQGSVLGQGMCGSRSGSQHGSQDEYASIVWWEAGKVASLCQKLAQIDDGDGKNVLDNTVIFYGTSMHGSDHRCDRLPAVLIGGGAGMLKTDQHIDFGTRPLRDMYYTLARDVFKYALPDFGTNATGAPPAEMRQLLVT